MIMFILTVRSQLRACRGGSLAYRFLFKKHLHTFARWESHSSARSTLRPGPQVPLQAKPGACGEGGREKQASHTYAHNCEGSLGRCASMDRVWA